MSLVRVAHGDERSRPAARRDPAHERDRAVERRARAKRGLGRALQRRAVRERVRIRQARPRAGRHRHRSRRGRGERRLRIGVARHDVRDEGRPAVLRAAANAAGDPARAPGVVRCPPRLGDRRPAVTLMARARLAARPVRQRAARAPRGPCPRAPDSPTRTTGSSGHGRPWARPSPSRPGEELRQRGERRGPSRAPAGCPRRGSPVASPRPPRGRSPRPPRAGPASASAASCGPTPG